MWRTHEITLDELKLCLQLLAAVRAAAAAAGADVAALQPYICTAAEGADVATVQRYTCTAAAGAEMAAVHRGICTASDADVAALQQDIPHAAACDTMKAVQQRYNQAAAQVGHVADASAGDADVQCNTGQLSLATHAPTTPAAATAAASTIHNGTVPAASLGSALPAAAAKESAATTSTTASIAAAAAASGAASVGSSQADMHRLDTASVAALLRVPMQLSFERHQAAAVAKAVQVWLKQHQQQLPHWSVVAAAQGASSSTATRARSSKGTKKA